MRDLIGGAEPGGTMRQEAAAGREGLVAWSGSYGRRREETRIGVNNGKGEKGNGKGEKGKGKGKRERGKGKALESRFVPGFAR